MQNITVSVWPFEHPAEQCGYYEGPAENSEEVEVDCGTNVSGRYVQVSGGGSHGDKCADRKFLNLCEVRVMGHRLIY